jgi:hypothetical protein
MLILAFAGKGGFSFCPPCPAGSISKFAGFSCEDCPADTYSLGASDSCTPCPEGSTTAKKPGSSNISSCMCDSALYTSWDEATGKKLCLTCPMGARCPDGMCAFQNSQHVCGKDGKQIVGTWASRKGEMRLMDCPSGSLLVNATTESQTCVACLPGTYSYSSLDGCGKVSCGDRKCNPCPAGARCGGADDFQPLVAGSEWKKVFDGSTVKMQLVDCPSGSLLVNATTELQTCVACLPGTYSYSSFDGCGKDSCGERKCNLCPAGARCGGADDFQPLVAKSEWEKVFDGSSVKMRLMTCPQGYVLVRRPDRPENDECVKCLPNTYMVEAASYETGKGVSSSAAILQSGLDLCRTCPLGSICNGQDEVHSM